MSLWIPGLLPAAFLPGPQIARRGQLVPHLAPYTASAEGEWAVWSRSQ